MYMREHSGWARDLRWLSPLCLPMFRAFAFLAPTEVDLSATPATQKSKLEAVHRCLLLLTAVSSALLLSSFLSIALRVAPLWRKPIFFSHDACVYKLMRNRTCVHVRTIILLLFVFNLFFFLLFRFFSHFLCFVWLLYRRRSLKLARRWFGGA